MAALLVLLIPVALLEVAAAGGGLAPASRPKVRPGVEVLLEERLDLLRGKRVGLITNPTGVTSDLRATVDVLSQAPEVRLVALFGPEHGVRGQVPAGVKIESYVDERTGLPVYSLYGKTYKPTPEMLRDVDVLVYDIQDIGSRAYTYIYTMAYGMEAARDKGIPFIVLDRPNPLGGDLIEGPVLEPAFKSGIGRYEIPYIYGLTVGELARLFNDRFGIGADLKVVPMRGWKRSMRFADTGLPWVPTSPHIPHAATAFYCATTGVIGELATVSEGVGYTLPFELVGAPWIDGNRFADELNQRNLPGVIFRPAFFRPYYFHFKDQDLQGVQIHIVDYGSYRPMQVQLHLLESLLKLYGERKVFGSERVRNFDRAMGTDKVRKALLRGLRAEEIIASWAADLQAYRGVRSAYLIYTP